MEKKNIIIATILILIPLVASQHPNICILTVSKAQEKISLDITGYTWDHSNISACIYPQSNESWWVPSYLNATLRAIAQWNDAIYEFGSGNTDFSFLTKIRIVPIISQEEKPGFDIYISWVDKCEDETRIGQSTPTIVSPCIITRNKVCLASSAPSGHVMSEVDMQNIALHELGHTLGLSHCSNPGDVMYYQVPYLDTVKELSSLDLYAVCTIFEWLSNSTQPSSAYFCPQDSSITLPSTINYYYFPISPQNLPATHPSNLIDEIVALFSHLETKIIVLAILTLVATVVLIRKEKRK